MYEVSDPFNQSKFVDDGTEACPRLSMAGACPHNFEVQHPPITAAPVILFRSAVGVSEWNSALKYQCLTDVGAPQHPHCFNQGACMRSTAPLTPSYSAYTAQVPSHSACTAQAPSYSACTTQVAALWTGVSGSRALHRGRGRGSLSTHWPSV